MAADANSSSKGASVPHPRPASGSVLAHCPDSSSSCGFDYSSSSSRHAWAGGLLGPEPQAHTALAPAEFSIPTSIPQQQFAPPPGPQVDGWDQASFIAAQNQIAPHGANPWVLDIGATSHMSSSDGILLRCLLPPLLCGHSIPVVSTSILPTATTSFYLNNVLVEPALFFNHKYSSGKPQLSNFIER